MTATQQSLSLRDIRANKDDVLYVRNNTHMTITLNTKDELFVLGPKGHGQDIDVLPRGCTMLSGFARMLADGSITVGHDLQDELDEAMRVADSERSAYTDSVSASLEAPATDVDMLEKVCVADGRERVFQTQAEIRDHVPPLCSQHKGQEHMFISQDQPDGSVRFVRVSVTKE